MPLSSPPHLHLSPSLHFLLPLIYRNSLYRSQPPPTPQYTMMHANARFLHPSPCTPRSSVYQCRRPSASPAQPIMPLHQSIRPLVPSVLFACYSLWSPLVSLASLCFLISLRSLLFDPSATSSHSAPFAPSALSYHLPLSSPKCTAR
ncbi:hypothetical protein EJ06DRAFT_531980 [Trichodelitschia bisporula]|uniref:Uncharacterized protein n=1 Tax=Trichodelitschia bisporula TaxID=703511 RepID=A0A6G1HSU7_9PEZI|nr:hypothetical protein EJ06DRAFT_531980 [Trichodelitschia bisporula]